MQMIIEVRLVDDVQETARVQLAVIDRELTTSPLGLSLAEGKALLASAQQYLVRAQCEGIGAAHAHCESCRAELTMKGWHERQIRTVFGRVKVRSPRVRCCSCAGRRPGASFSPLTRVVPACMTPELEYLQVKWAAHLPFSTARRCSPSFCRLGCDLGQRCEAPRACRRRSSGGIARSMAHRRSGAAS